jgi:hypothetical protein
VLAFRRERKVMSKAQAGEWGVRFAPEEYRSLVAAAAAWYEGPHDVQFDREAVSAFIEWLVDTR